MFFIKIKGIPRRNLESRKRSADKFRSHNVKMMIGKLIDTDNACTDESVSLSLYFILCLNKFVSCLLHIFNEGQSNYVEWSECTMEKAKNRLFSIFRNNKKNSHLLFGKRNFAITFQRTKTKFRLRIKLGHVLLFGKNEKRSIEYSILQNGDDAQFLYRLINVVGSIITFILKRVHELRSSTTNCIKSL